MGHQVLNRSCIVPEHDTIAHADALTFEVAIEPRARPGFLHVPRDVLLRENGLGELVRDLPHRD
jgi:hypothetical protein